MISGRSTGRYLAHALIAAGSVDEYRLSVYPAVQGRGGRLFPDGVTIPRLRVIEEPRTFPAGITMLKYASTDVV